MGYARFRVNHQPNGYGYFRKEFTNNNVTTLYAEADYLTSSGSESISDIVTPGFRKAIASGAVINNPCTYVRDGFVETTGSYIATHSSQPWRYQAWGPVISDNQTRSSFGAYDNLPVLDYDGLVAQAKQQCLADINSTPYSFAEDALELASTLRYLKAPGKSLLKLAEDMQKRSWKIRKTKGQKARRIANELNDLYLQRQFVMRPLVQSASDILDAYRDKQNYRAERYSARGFASDSDSYSGNLDVSLGWNAYDHYTITNEITCKVHAYVLYSHGESRGALHKLGLRGDDGFVALWNIVPLSFMVDRLYDISSLLKGAQALHDPRLGILAAGLVLRTKKTGKIDYVGQTNPSWSVSVSGTQEYSNFKYERYPWTPHFSDTIPVLRPSNLVRDATNVAELFSLSAGIIYRSIKPGHIWHNAT